MGQIELKCDPPRDLTIFQVTGQMQVADFKNALADYYRGDVTRLILWDLTRADLLAFRNRHIKEVAQGIAQISEARRGGRTAFVYDESFEYGIGRMFQAYSQMAEMPSQARASARPLKARTSKGISAIWE